MLFYNMNIAVNIIYKVLDTGYDLKMVMLFCLVYRRGGGLSNQKLLWRRLAQRYGEMDLQSNSDDCNYCFYCIF